MFATFVEHSSLAASADHNELLYATLRSKLNTACPNISVQAMFGLVRQVRTWPGTKSKFELWAICAAATHHSSSNSGKYASDAGDGHRDSQGD